MRDSKLAIRTAYFNTLNGNIVLGNINVPALDRIPNDQKAPYVKLSTQTAVEAVGGKIDCQVQETTILLDIVTAYDGNRGGKQDSDLIADQCFVLLTGDPLPAIVGNFKIVQTVVDSDFDLEEALTPTSLLIRRLIRFRNFIEQIA